MTEKQPVEDIVFSHTPDGVELVATPHRSLISWQMLEQIGNLSVPSAQIADGEITLSCTNATATYRIVGAEPFAAVVELVRVEQLEEK